jgi:hypothetical protein
MTPLFPYWACVGNRTSDRVAAAAVFGASSDDKVQVRGSVPPFPSTDPPGPMEDVAATEGIPTAMDTRLPSPELLSELAEEFQDLKYPCDRDLVHIYFALRSLYRTAPPVPKDFVSPNVFDKNITSRNVSDLLHLVKMAVREKDWKDVVSHGMHLALRWNCL